MRLLASAALCLLSLTAHADPYDEQRQYLEKQIHDWCGRPSSEGYEAGCQNFRDSLRYLKSHRAEQKRLKKMSPAARAYQECHSGNNLDIGMSQRQVINSCWGRPSDASRYTSASGVHESWTYSSGQVLYFSDGRLVGIHE
jgi:hypothetical protein